MISLTESNDDQPIVPKIKAGVYRELFEASDWMLRARPWEKMKDFHCFVVVDPDTGEEQVAAVMGAGGTFFALHLYQPEEGSRWLTRQHLTGGADAQSAHDAQFDQRLLEVEFTDGSEMDDHDEWLDENFAPESWMDFDELDVAIFRTIEPACFPWHPEEGQALRMTDGLRLLRRYYEDYFEEYEWATFSPDEDGTVPKVPTFQLPAGADRSDASAWEFSMREFQPPGPKTLPEIPSDDLLIERLSTFKVKAGTRWELGSVFSPKPVLSGGRPVFPLVGIVGDTSTGRAEGTELVSALDQRAQIFGRNLTKAAEATGYLPAEIAVASPVAELALNEVAKARGIKLVVGEPMPVFEDILRSLQSSPLFMTQDDEILDDLSPEDMAEMDELVKAQPGADATEEEVLAFISRLQQSKAGEAIFQQIAEAMASGDPAAGLAALENMSALDDGADDDGRRDDER